MMNTLPLRRTTLHLAQRFRIDGDTFIEKYSLHSYLVAELSIIHSVSMFVQPTRSIVYGSEDSQDQRVSFSDSHTVLEMRRQ